MKKILIALIMAVSLTGCNKQIVDFTYAFDSAIIELPNGEVIKGSLTIEPSIRIRQSVQHRPE